MARVANSHGTIYNGVTQQPPSLRSSTQCEEAYNVDTSIEYGLIRRQPLENPDGIENEFPVMSESYSNSYSKMIIDGKSVYQLNINDGLPSVVQIEPYFKVVNPGSGIGHVNISDGAARYLRENNNGIYDRGQYSTTTIKNTTLISNESVVPTATKEFAAGGRYGEWAIVWLKTADPSAGVEYSITINGTEFTTFKKDRGSENKSNYTQPYAAGDMGWYETYIRPPIRPVDFRNARVDWDSDLHSVIRVGFGSLPVQRSGATREGTFWLTSAEVSAWQSYWRLVTERENEIASLNRTIDRRRRLEELQHNIDKWINQDISHPKDTATAVDELEIQIREHGYDVRTDGSMMAIKIGKDSTISTSDSLANTAMAAFHRDIQSIETLPSNINSLWTFVRFRVKQDTTSEKATFYIRWTGKVWEESTDDYEMRIDPSTMPVSMKVAFFDNGSIARVDIDVREWDNRLVGDDITNKGPKFLNRKPIRDIFFYRNRIGFLTDEGISMTESGQYSNLWRTTTVATLDSDPIDFIVSTNSSTSLRYTVMNQDRIFIFADNVQFMMDGGQVLGPKSVKVNEISHYILNLDVEPITLENKIVMIGKSADTSIVYEYTYDGNYGIAHASPITSNVPGYIPADVQSLAASSEDGMIFLVARDNRDKLLPYNGPSYFRDILSNEPYHDMSPSFIGKKFPDRNIIYVYKYRDSGGKRVQSSWSKWNYRGSVVQVSAARGYAYIDIDHEFNGDAETTVIGTGVWSMTGSWMHKTMMWEMSTDHYQENVQLQKRIARQSLKPKMVESIAGEYIEEKTALGITKRVFTDYRDFGKYVNRSFVDLGEFVFKDRASKQYTAGNSVLSMVNIHSDPSSLHSVIIRDMDTGREREVGPMHNKRFKGRGLAANYYQERMGAPTLAGSAKKHGDKFDTSQILDTDSRPLPVRGEKTLAANSFDGAFDTARIANVRDEMSGQPITNDEMPKLYGRDVPVMVGGRTISTRVVISSYYDSYRDYGFKINDIIQEAEINVRFKLS